MSYQKYQDASHRVVDYFVSHLTADGEIKGEDVEKDPAFYCKLPALLFVAGKTEQGNAVLSYIKKTFMTAEGDVRATAEQKTRNGALNIYPTYVNGWVAKAAILGDKPELLKRLENFYKNCKCETSGGWLNKAGGSLDCLTTSHIGLLALMSNDLDTAKAAGNFLVKSLNVQDLHQGDTFYTRSHEDGTPLTSFPDDEAPFCAIKTSAPNQLYFFLGYPAAFLALIYEATDHVPYLTTAKQILDFALRCDDGIYKFLFAHKVAWAASIVARITKEGRYVELSRRIADYLLTLQDQENGMFLCDQSDAMDKYDQSAELAQWFREIAKNLSKV